MDGGDRALSVHYSEADLRALVPALFPAGRVCQNWGKAAFRVVVHERGKTKGIVNSGFRVCGECKDMVEFQAAEAGLVATVEEL